MKKLHVLSFILLIVGGLNWLLIGLFNWGVGDFLPSGLTKLVYVLVGLAAVYELATHNRNCQWCGKKV